MPNVILPNLGIELPDVGSDQDTWGDILNADLQILDKAVQYDVISKTLAGVDVTLTDVEAASAVINLTGTLTANVNVIVPATPVRLYLVRNQTSGAFTVTVKTAAGTGTPVQQGASSLVYSDGTNIIQGATSVNGSFAVSGAFTAGSLNSTPVGNATPSSGAFTNLSYTGTLTGGTGAVNIGSGQVSKDDNGNVAIANATPSAWATFKGLDLNTYGAVAASTSATTVAGNCFFNGTNWIYKQTGPASRTELINGQWVVFTAPSGTAGTAITFTQAMTLFQSGNLNIGGTSDLGNRITITGADATTFARFSSSSSSTFIGGAAGLITGAANADSAVRSDANLLFAAGGGTEAARITTAGQLLVGTTTASTGAFAEFTSTTGALIVPRMTTAQRDAMGAVANGAIIYNTTTNKMNFRENGAWVQPNVTAA